MTDFKKNPNTTIKPKDGGIKTHIPKVLNPRLCDDLNCFLDKNFQTLCIQDKCVLNLSYCTETICRDVFGKLVMGIDLAMAEGKSVILAGDHISKYFAMRGRSMLQSVLSSCDLNQSNIDTNTRMTNSCSIRIDNIITDDYESSIVADTILKTDRFATITAL